MKSIRYHLHFMVLFPISVGISSVNLFFGVQYSLF
uniref:Uncharacterized protein n=1 Tax=Arundo donax TaxID=35708 RepID=A0A0A8YC81_ARUDO